MSGKLAKRLERIDGKTVVFLDCGKRGGAPILEGIERELAAAHDFAALRRKKTSAHSVASKKLIDEIADTCDAVVYGVVN